MSEAIKIALIVALPSVAAVATSAYASHKAHVNLDDKLTQIHGLVNSRLAAALTEIKDLKSQLVASKKAPKNKGGS